MNGSNNRPITRKVFFAKRVKTEFLAGILFLVCASLAHAQAHIAMSGMVMDSTGAPIQGAQIEFRTAIGLTFTTTDNKGFFRLEVGEAGGTLLVSFPGFGPASREIKPDTSIEGLQIQLSPASDLQRIQVQGNTGDRIPATPTSQYEISSEAIEVSGSFAIDDVLRQVPGFSTYRRSSSLFANPTSQGVSLRGVGASATSRSNVLLDGIPLNDPFGGWVYWARLPRIAIDSVQVVNGSASDLYGGGALGGVVNLRTSTGETAYARGEVSYGSMDTPDISFAVGMPIGKWSINAAGQAYQTDGYIAVPRDQRGIVDTNVGSGALTGFVEGSRSLGEHGKFFVRGSGFGQSAENGTRLQKDDTTIPELDLGADWNSTEVGSLSGRVYGLREIYHQTFSSIATDRSAESLTNVQKNPSQEIGLVGTWSRLFVEKQKVSVGVEALDTRGHSAETNYRLGQASALVDAGGRQHSFGFFAQDAYFLAPGWLLTFGGRIDTWNNNTGYQKRTPLPSGTPTASTFPERTETAFSPRVSLLKSFAKGVALNASVYRGYRAPNLNELYRNFRVGNIVTLANPALTGEHLTGGEAGLSVQRWNNRVTMRGNFFWSEISDPVANVTLTSTPTLITRQKENLGETQARGFELAGELHVNPRIQVTAAYLFVNSTVLSFASNPALAGNFLPQVPQNQFSFQVSYLGRNWSAGLQGRFGGQQFDDDQNRLPLGRAFSLDAEVSRKFGWHTSVFFAVQNLTNDRFYISATPVFTEGPPIFVRGGLRFAWQ